MQAPEAAAPVKRHGLVVVHGIGMGRRRGEQLAEVLNSIADLLQESGGRVVRRFNADAPPAQGSLTVTPPDGSAPQEIDATEVFWDDAFPSPPPRTVVRWLLDLGPRQLREIARGLLRDPANDEPAPGDQPEPGPRDDYLAGFVVKWAYRFELLVITVLLAIAYALTWLLVPVLWVLYALAETPGLRMFGLWDRIASVIHALDPFLGSGLGDTQRFLDDGMWSTNVVRLVEEAIIPYLLSRDIADVTLLAHSQGAALAFDALRAGGPVGEAAGRLDEPKRLTLVTVGSAVNRNYRLSATRPSARFAGRLPQQPFDARITGVRADGPVPFDATDEEARRLRSYFYWLDLYARLDAVPAGGLLEAVRESARVHPWQLKRRQVINQDNPLRDHTTYFRNRELVVPRIARAIYGGEYPWTRPPDSSAPTPEITPERVRHRIDRVAVLQLLRMLFVAGVGALAALMVFHNGLRERVAGLLGPMLDAIVFVGELYGGPDAPSGDVLPAIVAVAIGAAVLLALLRAAREWWFADL